MEYTEEVKLKLIELLKLFSQEVENTDKLFFKYSWGLKNSFSNFKVLSEKHKLIKDDEFVNSYYIDLVSAILEDTVKCNIINLEDRFKSYQSLDYEVFKYDYYFFQKIITPIDLSNASKFNDYEDYYGKLTIPGNDLKFYINYFNKCETLLTNIASHFGLDRFILFKSNIDFEPLLGIKGKYTKDEQLDFVYNKLSGFLLGRKSIFKLLMRGEELPVPFKVDLDPSKLDYLLDKLTFIKGREEQFKLFVDKDGNPLIYNGNTSNSKNFTKFIKSVFNDPILKSTSKV